MFTVRVPFTVPEKKRIREDAATLTVNGVIHTLSFDGHHHILKSAGFPTEEAAHDFLNRLEAGFAWLLLDNGIPAAPFLVPQDVTYHEDPEAADLSEAALLERVAALNADPAIHGILVQMPLPRHIDARKVIAAIAVEKDVDGFSVHSAGALASGLPGLRPCTPWGCMKLIESTGERLGGKHAVVIGRSNTVGKPMART